MTDEIFADLHEDIFEEFGQDGTVIRGYQSPVDVRVIVERGVQQLGEYGQVVATVDTISFMVSQWTPAQGDAVALASGERKVHLLLSDDGFVAKATLYG